jgi:para-nitrobenzyl esterase
MRVPFLLLSISTLALCQGPGAACGPVMTDKGAVSGSPAGSGCAFKGIPYAQPPTRGLRFKPPVPRDPWTGVLSTTDFANRCAQLDANNNVVGAEDCLYVNLWVPASSGNAPVMVFFHGGFHVTGNIGSGGIPLYDGQYLMERFGVIVVTLQSRLNVLGYLAHPALDAESPQGVSGNYGFLDEVAALQWLQHNIAAFGGDPSRVMLFGFSAGGADMGVHLVSPLSKGLFSAIVIQSPWAPLDSLPTLVQSEQGIGAHVATATGCAADSDVAACLRALPL